MKTTGADTQGGGKLLYLKPYLTSCNLLPGVQSCLSGSECVKFKKRRKSEKRTVRDRTTDESRERGNETDRKHERGKDGE